MTYQSNIFIAIIGTQLQNKIMNKKFSVFIAYLMENKRQALTNFNNNVICCYQKSVNYIKS